MERLRDEDGRFKARTFEVTVWDNMNGDIECYRDEATQAEVDDIERNYDEPIYHVQIEPND